jgi:peptide/nickel transport system ATP-binding protein
MSDLLLDIRGLRVTYTTEEGLVAAVDNLDLQLRRGETLGLVGETGAGKTTTALSVMQLVPDPPGRIEKGEIFGSSSISGEYEIARR